MSGQTMFTRRTLIPTLLTLVFLVGLNAFFGCGSDPTTPSQSNDMTDIRFEVDLDGGESEFEIVVGEREDRPGPFILRGSNIHYDTEWEALVVDLTLVNASERAYPEPVTLTFEEFLPASVTVLNADNGETGPGALFHVEFANDDAMWTQGEESFPIPVQFGVEQGMSIGFVARVDVGDSPDLGGIGGLVWHDRNEDGEIGDHEEGIPGVGVLLTGDDIERRVETHEGGRYRFDGLPAGLYTVTRLPRDDLEPTTPVTLHAVLVDTDDGVSDFLEANFGCIIVQHDEAPVRVGDFVSVAGEHMREPHRIVAWEIGVGRHGDEDGDCDHDHGGHNDENGEGNHDECEGGPAELRGVITDVAHDDQALEIMGSWVVFDPDEGVGQGGGNDCGDELEDLEVGERVATRIDEPVPESDDRPLVGSRLRCWNGHPEKVKGTVREIIRNEDDEIVGLVVLRTFVELTPDTEWDRE